MQEMATVKFLMYLSQILDHFQYYLVEIVSFLKYP